MTICIYNNGTVTTFEHFPSACAFMEEMEDEFGFTFELESETGECSVYVAR